MRAAEHGDANKISGYHSGNCGAPPGGRRNWSKRKLRRSEGVLAEKAEGREEIPREALATAKRAEGWEEVPREASETGADFFDEVIFAWLACRLDNHWMVWAYRKRTSNTDKDCQTHHKMPDGLS
ncbi:hypothetical protein AgCh_007234 [Apium graveolens]